LRALSAVPRAFESIAPGRDDTSKTRAIHRLTLRSLWLLLLLACLLALTACGSKQDALSAPATKPFTVMLDFFPNADHAALYSAIANGDFKAVGLDVRPQTPSDPSTPLKLLAAGRVDMAISYEPELLLARDRHRLRADRQRVHGAAQTGG
jgi:ABC-type nitrate/sulfonate/bicarbonate transport system substrate-binding protein